MQKKFNKLISRSFYVSLITNLYCASAYAADSESPVGRGLNYILTDVLYSGTGATLGTLAVAGVGLACKFGLFEWRRLGQTIAGISLMFGAPAIVSTIKSVIN